jgi:putative nucleotidyltransferase with HDIG domain
MRASLPVANRAFLTAAISSGVAVLLVSISQMAATEVPLSWFALVGLTVLSGSATLRLPNVPVSFSISDTFTITAALLFGPAAGAVAVAVDSLVISFRLARRNFGLQRLLFNAAAPALAMWTAAHCFFRLAAVGPLIDASAPVGRLVGPLIAFAALYFVFNTGLIACAIAFEQRASVVTIWRHHFLSLWMTYFGGATVAAIVITLVSSQGPDVMVLAIVAPMPVILYATFKNSVGRLEDQLAHLGKVNRMYLSTIETLAHAIDAKDQVTHGHIRRVQHHAIRLARAIGIDDERELQALGAASLLHDMGKLGVPEHILNKPGKLTDAEFEQMKRHVTIGVDILSSVDFPYPVVPIVRCHHENWDGTGYPLGLKGEAIPIGARILSVVDCFDALTSDRPYRPKMTTEEAIAILRERSGSMYDPRIVDTFVDVCAAEPVLQDANPAPPALAAITQMAQSDGSRWPGAGDSYERAILEAVYEIGAAVASGADTAAIIARLHRSLEQVMPATCTVLYLYDQPSDLLIAQHASGDYATVIQGLVIPLGHRLTGWVAVQRSTIVNSDAALDLGNLSVRLTPPPHACLSTALYAGEELVGALTVYSMLPAPFTHGHAALLETLAPRIAAAARKHASEAAVVPPRTADRFGGRSVLRFSR